MKIDQKQESNQCPLTLLGFFGRSKNEDNALADPSRKVAHCTICAICGPLGPLLHFYFSIIPDVSTILTTVKKGGTLSLVARYVTLLVPYLIFILVFARC